MSAPKSGRPRGPIREAIRLALMGRELTRHEVARLALVGSVATERTVWNMVTAGEVEVARYEQRPGSRRPLAVFRLVPEEQQHHDGGAALQSLMSRWTSPRCKTLSESQIVDNFGAKLYTIEKKAGLELLKNDAMPENPDE